MRRLDPKLVQELTKELVDKGKVIEAGWVGLRLTVIQPDAPEVQVREMRTAFYAGAQHLFASIMSILDPGAEATEKDLERLTLIQRELDFYITTLEWPGGVHGTKA